VLVIDEIDASFHPLLTARLIALFRDSSANPQGAQLIFSTHDASLLSPVLGEEVLRRDEVWFVQKDSAGGTELYPLSDFHPRKGENTERRYLGGSYGAAPVLFAENFTDAVGLGLIDEPA
jgi:AAA15 family ATPase/GTPase